MNRVSKFTSVAIGCLLIFALATPAWAANQRAVSFGTTLPSTCFPGDLFFKTNAAAGTNIYACVTSNTWVVQGLVTLSGDVTGQPSATTVTQIQGHAVATTAPAAGQTLTWNSSTNSWAPQTPSSGGGSTTLGGDVVGPAATNTVTQIQGHPVISTTPTVGQTLVWSGTTWQPQTPSSGGGSTTLGGDVVGPSGTNTVTQIQGHPVISTTPTVGQTLVWSGTTWQPQTPSSGGGSTTLGGDVVGAAGANTVTQIQGHPVVSTTPTAGQALVWNGTTANWGPQTLSTGGGSGTGASMASQLGDLIVTLTSGAVLTIGPNCSFTTPCNVRFGALTYSLTTPVTATISSGTGNAYFYVASSGILTAGNSMVVSCSGTCTAPTGVTSFPTDSIPLFLWHATNGVWDPSGSDQRAFLSTKDILPGTGLTSLDSSGFTTLSVDPSVVPVLSTLPTSGQVPEWNGSAWVPATPTGGSGGSGPAIAATYVPVGNGVSIAASGCQITGTGSIALTCPGSVAAGALGLKGQTSGNTVTETTDPNTAVYTLTHPRLAPTAAGQVRKITAVSAGVTTEAWDTPVFLDTAPANGQTLVWNSSTSQWVPTTLSGGGGGTSVTEHLGSPIGSCPNGANGMNWSSTSYQGLLCVGGYRPLVKLGNGGSDNILYSFIYPANVTTIQVSLAFHSDGAGTATFTAGMYCYASGGSSTTNPVPATVATQSISATGNLVYGSVTAVPQNGCTAGELAAIVVDRTDTSAGVGIIYVASADIFLTRTLP
jgi:hypothetical protein